MLTVIAGSTWVPGLSYNITLAGTIVLVSVPMQMQSYDSN